ncbi:MAG: MYG1 family protein [Clostridia bacterium]|nr:MYG1 family protein [Clostridia bacterium]
MLLRGIDSCKITLWREGVIIDTKKQFRKVGTHNGRFHADEVMATAILKELFDVEVVRTRDTEILSKLDLVYDVGDGEFDHHQVEKEYRENGTPYAACGLIWRKFGKEVIVSREPQLQEKEVDEIFSDIDAVLIESIDAADNGIRTTETIIPTMNITSIIAGFNPPWDDGISEEKAFSKAVEFASATLGNTINQRISNIKAREYVVYAYNNRVRPELLILEAAYPWANTLSRIDREKEVLFVIYPREEQYLLQTVRDNGSSFRDRKRLPKAWAGKREEELGKIVGIDDAVFCHPSRFIAGAGSFESIMKMAEIAIAEPVQEKREVPRGFMVALKRFLLSKKIVIKR